MGGEGAGFFVETGLDMDIENVGEEDLDRKEVATVAVAEVALGEG